MEYPGWTLIKYRFNRLNGYPKINTKSASYVNIDRVKSAREEESDKRGCLCRNERRGERGIQTRWRTTINFGPSKEQDTSLLVKERVQ